MLARMRAAYAIAKRGYANWVEVASKRAGQKVQVLRAAARKVLRRFIASIARRVRKQLLALLNAKKVKPCQ